MIYHPAASSRAITSSGGAITKRTTNSGASFASSGQPWSTAKLVLMNENQKLAPDRQVGILGSDHGYEYKLYRAL